MAQLERICQNLVSQWKDIGGKKIVSLAKSVASEGQCLVGVVLASSAAQSNIQTFRGEREG